MDMSKYAGKESQYLKAADLKGRTPNVVISAVELVEFDKEDGSKQVKPAVALEGKEKKLVLNATNTDALNRKFGPQSDDWIGKTIMLSSHYYAAFDKEGLVVTPIIADDDPDDSLPF